MIPHYTHKRLLHSLSCIGALILCGTVCTANAGNVWSPFEATYEIGTPRSTVAVLSIVVTQADHRLSYRSTVVPRGFLGHLLNLRTQSRSEMIRHGAHWLPLIYEKEGARARKKQQYRFDWQNSEAQLLYKGKRYTVSLEAGVVDENTLQFQLIDDVINTRDQPFERSYTVISDGRLKTRRFVKRGIETTTTELGSFSVIRIERHKEGTVDQIYWLSPQHNYLPLKMAKLEGGTVKTMLTLQQFKLTATR